MIEVVYVAHPVSGDVTGNAARARRWLRWLIERELDVSFCVPWLPYIEVLDEEGNAGQRERGLRDVVAIAGRCHGIVLCGGRISAGMKREAREVLQVGNGGVGGWVVDLTDLGVEPPDQISSRPLDLRWIECSHGDLRRVGRNSGFLGGPSGGPVLQ